MKTLGTDPQVIAGARKLVAAEQNFNPFNFKIPSICSDVSLPATPELRGVVPLVDPAVTGADLQNANSAKSLTTPFDATGLSVAGVMAAQGFSNFTSVDASGGKADGAASGDLNATSPAPAAQTKRNAIDARSRQLVDGVLKNALNNPVIPRQAAKPVEPTLPPVKIPRQAAEPVEPTLPPVKIPRQASDSTAAALTDRNTIDTRSRKLVDGALINARNNPVIPRQDSNSSNTTPPPATGGDTTSSLAGADFGQCTPTIDLKLGRPGRKATEATFLPSDPLVANGQQDAFAVGIITNRICDQLTNVCGANQAAKDACQAAKATVAALGTKDQSTADAWNKALGF